MDDALSGLGELFELSVRFWMLLAITLGIAKVWPTVRDRVREEVWPLRRQIREWTNSLQVWTLAHLPRHALAGQDPLSIRAALDFPAPRTAPALPPPHIIKLGRDAVRGLRASCAHLGVGVPPHSRVSRALFLGMAHHNNRVHWICFGLLASLAWAPRSTRVAWSAARDLLQRARDTGLSASLVPDAASKVVASSNARPSDLIAQAVGGALIVWVMVPALLFLLGWPFLILWGAITGKRIPVISMPSAVANRRYGLVRAVAAAVSACADVRTARALNRPDALHAVSEKLAEVEGLVLKAHRTSGVLRRRSPLRKVAKAHVLKVATRLRAAEADLIDPAVEAGSVHEPDTPATLAGLLLTIADRYTTGQIGILLDPEDLDHPKMKTVEPVRDRELVRVVVLVLLWAVGAWGVGLLSLPGVAEPVAMGAVAVVIAVLLYRRRWLSLFQWMPFNPFA
ncbi:hypothetical protein [Streptomyces sp. NBC_01207]|uniref:hypothetical protein n=1 Tax=Streptomyces sp. NBC_01207 TaxID=2903772 RepID=UPI002E128FFE|nr:hypothetical protein OG457_48085 [Streptomyces sp. NBC_01207]